MTLRATQLHGFNTNRRRIVSSMSEVGTGTAGASAALAYPSGIRKGDVIIVGLVKTVNTLVPPSGGDWQNLFADFANSNSTQLYALICDGTETGNMYAATASEFKAYIHMRGDVPISALDNKNLFKIKGTAALSNTDVFGSFSPSGEMLDPEKGAFILLTIIGATAALSTRSVTPARTTVAGSAANRIEVGATYYGVGSAFPDPVSVSMNDVGAQGIMTTVVQFYADLTPATALNTHASTTQSTGTSANITLPSCRKGDLLVVYQYVTATTSDLTDAGNQRISGFDCFNCVRITIFQTLAIKIAEDSDSGATVVLRNPTTITTNRYIAVAFRAERPIEEFVVMGGPDSAWAASYEGNQSSADIPATDVITAAKHGDYFTTVPGLTVACYAATAAVSPRTWTSANAEDTEYNGGTQAYMKTRIMFTPTAVAINSDDEGSYNSLVGLHIVSYLSAV